MFAGIFVDLVHAFVAVDYPLVRAHYARFVLFAFIASHPRLIGPLGTGFRGPCRISQPLPWTVPAAS